MEKNKDEIREHKLKFCRAKEGKGWISVQNVATLLKRERKREGSAWAKAWLTAHSEELAPQMEAAELHKPLDEAVVLLHTAGLGGGEPGFPA